MYTACKPRTGMGWGGKAGAYRTCSRDDDDGEDKNNNILVVARAKRACLGVAEHHHHRARSFIGPASSLLDQAWHVSVISRRNPPPRAVSSSQTLVSSSHTHTSSPQHKETSPVCLLSSPTLPWPALLPSALPTTRLARSARPHRRQLVPTPNPLPALPHSIGHSPQSTHASPALRLHYYRLRTCPPTT
jgi:hypothetical protein